MERGSDRLALITGQLHNVDPSSPSFSSSSSTSHQRTYSESFMPQTQSEHRQIQESPSLKYQFKGIQTIVIFADPVFFSMIPLFVGFVRLHVSSMLQNFILSPSEILIILF